jgi:hypothetical protein
VSKSISELQERIIRTLWEKRCRFEWKQDNSRDEWIGRIPHDEWEASFPDTPFRKWTKQQLREWRSDDNWVCELVNHSGLWELYKALIPPKATDTERRKHMTAIARAVDRLGDRGLVARNRSRGVIELTPWGSLYGWLIDSGRLTSTLRSRKHSRKEPSYEHKPHRAYRLAELEASMRGPAMHERIIGQIRELSDWEKQAIFDELKLMVETSPIGSESTDNPMELVNG